LLAQVAPSQCDLLARRVAVDLDVVADRRGRHERNYTVGDKPPPVDYALKHLPSIGINIACRLADDGVLENRREWSRQLPGLEEGAPVDIVRELRQADVPDFAPAEQR